MNSRQTRVRRHADGVIVVVLLCSAFFISSSSGGAATQVRGFDGTTIKVAGIGDPTRLGGAERGARARINRFNDSNELKGVKIEYVGFADDKSDQATSLSEQRRLVSQEGVFAIVGDVSSYNSYDYLAQNKVPFFGWGTDKAYCSPKVTTSLWGFGFNGCQANPSPLLEVDKGGKWYKLASEKLGKKHPTIAIIAQETAVGKASTASTVIAYKGAGFDVVYAKATMPEIQVGDYTPYVQELLTADNGNPPDMIRCASGTECLKMWVIIQASGYKGIYQHSLYTDVLVKAFNGSYAGTSNANISDPGIPALEQMKADLEAEKPGTKVEFGSIAGYASTDMFIQALKKAAKAGKSAITPENVRKAASKMTWEMKGFTGPTVYPTATNRQDPYCTSIGQSDGTKWVTVDKYDCSSKTFPAAKK